MARRSKRSKKSKIKSIVDTTQAKLAVLDRINNFSLDGILKRAIAARSARLNLPSLDNALKNRFKNLVRHALRVERQRQSRPHIKPQTRPLVPLLSWKERRALQICKERNARHHAIMSKTKGKGMKVKFAQWTNDSRVRCKKG